MNAFTPEGYLSETIENTNNLKNISTLQECMVNGKILESRAIVCDSEHNLIVNLGSIKGIIPRNECALGIEEGTTRDIAIISRVNKPVCFKILGFDKDENGKTIAILSRKQAQLECLEIYVKSLSKGDIIKAKVTHLEPFGCFVDIGCGIISLIPIDAISVSRISHPKDRFKVSQNILAIVKSIESDGKVCLSHKELLGSWEENANCFKAGETVAGTIRSIEDYGVFVELSPNLAGLAEIKDDVKIGQQASVYIKSLIPDKMKVKLIIVDSFDDNVNVSDITYFNQENHIDYWKYSPDSCDKVIETIF